MHELSIAQSILQAALGEANRIGGRSISRIEATSNLALTGRGHLPLSYPVDRARVLTFWIGLALVLAVGAGSFALKQHRVS